MSSPDRPCPGGRHLEAASAGGRRGSARWAGLSLGLLLAAGWVLSANPVPKRVIVLDPGHGGDDTGVRIAGGSVEKEITLAFCGSLKAVLLEDPSLDVILTRDGDQNVPLPERAVQANRSGTAVFLSIHCSSSRTPADAGFQIFYFQPDPGQMDEYHSIQKEIGGRIVQLVPLPLAQVPSVAASKELAGALQARLNTWRNLSSGAPVGERLELLAMVRCPAVLLEVGFLTNPDEEKNLGDSAYRTTYSRQIRETLLDFFKTGPAAGGEN